MQEVQKAGGVMAPPELKFLKEVYETQLDDNNRMEQIIGATGVMVGLG